ncbi:MAG: regulatory protein RecX [Thermaurantimonas sp.]
MESHELKSVKKDVLRYCSYRERTSGEVLEYLKKFRLNPVDEGKLMCELIENDVINDFRFAKMYVSGKFRVNGWGRDKIAYRLKAMGLSDTLIKLALEEIDEEDYTSLAKKFIEKKRLDLRNSKSSAEINKKIFNYLKSKGFESDLISHLLKVSD